MQTLSPWWNFWGPLCSERTGLWWSLWVPFSSGYSTILWFHQLLAVQKSLSEVMLCSNCSSGLTLPISHDLQLNIPAPRVHYSFPTNYISLQTSCQLNLRSWKHSNLYFFSPSYLSLDSLWYFLSASVHKPLKSFPRSEVRLPPAASTQTQKFSPVAFSSKFSFNSVLRSVCDRPWQFWGRRKRKRKKRSEEGKEKKSCKD